MMLYLALAKPSVYPMTPDEFRHLQRGQCWQKLVLGAIPEIHQLNEVTVAGNELRTALLGSKTVMLALLGFLYFVLFQSPISLRLGLIAWDAESCLSNEKLHIWEACSNRLYSTYNNFLTCTHSWLLQMGQVPRVGDGDCLRSRTEGESPCDV